MIDIKRNDHSILVSNEDYSFRCIAKDSVSTEMLVKMLAKVLTIRIAEESGGDMATARFNLEGYLPQFDDIMIDSVCEYNDNAYEDYRK
jgi:hypothetical protein